MIIRPRNWKSFQHYTDRKPAWIKLHRELLDNFDYHCLPDASAALAPKLWLLASESDDGSIDATPEKLAFRLRKTAAEIVSALKPLIAAKFFEVVQDASSALADRKQNGVSEEERETEEERELEKDKCPAERDREAEPGALADSHDSAARIFAHWQETHGHPRARLDPKRRKVIASALKAYSEADLCRSITGYRNSPHHMGENDRNTVYDDIELMLRDAKHIEAGLRFCDNPPSNLSRATLKAVSNTADWQPPEARSATQ